MDHDDRRASWMCILFHCNATSVSTLSLTPTQSLERMGNSGSSPTPEEEASVFSLSPEMQGRFMSQLMVRCDRHV